MNNPKSHGIGYVLMLLLPLALCTCTEEVLVERTVYDTVYLQRPLDTVVYTQHDTVWVSKPVYDTVYVTETVIELDTVYVTETVIKLDTVYVTDTEYRVDTVYVEHVVEHVDTVYVAQMVERIDTVYVEQVDTLQYSNTITVPWFWRKYVDNFLAAVEECKFPLLARDVVIDTTFHEHVPIYGGDTLIYAYSYMRDATPIGNLPGYDGYWYINIDIAKKDCAEAIIYRELMHRLAGWSYAGDWRLWNHFIGDSYDIGYDPNKDQIMYQNWPGCLEEMEAGDYYRVRYLADLMPCLE